MFPVYKHNDVSYYYATKKLQIVKTSKSHKPTANVKDMLYSSKKYPPPGDSGITTYIERERERETL